MGRKKLSRNPYTVTIDFSEDTTVGTLAGVSLNGILRGILLDVPDLTGTTTLTFTITDESGYTVYTKASIAENQKTALYVDANNIPLELPLVGSHTLTVTASNAQGADQDVDVELIVEDK